MRRRKSFDYDLEVCKLVADPRRRGGGSLQHQAQFGLNLAGVFGPTGLQQVTCVKPTSGPPGC